MSIKSSFKRQGRVVGLFSTTARNRFETRAVQKLELGFSGIAGDRHEGLTRRTGGREPWYPRGTEIRNERQLSLLCRAELAAIAAALNLPEIKPEWMGGNLLIEGLPDLTELPPRTCLFFEGGVTIRIDGLNVPCRATGRSIASHYPERDNLDLAFVRAARRLRGLVGYIEKPGIIAKEETLEAWIPEHWIHKG